MANFRPWWPTCVAIYGAYQPWLVWKKDLVEKENGDMQYVRAVLLCGRVLVVKIRIAHHTACGQSSLLWRADVRAGIQG